MNYQILTFLLKFRKYLISHFQNGLFGKNNPRRVRRRLAQRLDPPGTPRTPQIIKFEMFTKSSKRGPQNLILGASCTELKGEQLWFSLKRLFFVTLTFLLTKIFQKHPTYVQKKCFFGTLAFVWQTFPKLSKQCQKHIQKWSEIDIVLTKWADNPPARSKIWLRSLWKGSRALNLENGPK